MLIGGVHHRHALLQMRLTRENIHFPTQEDIVSTTSILTKEKIKKKKKQKNFCHFSVPKAIENMAKVRLMLLKLILFRYNHNIK